MAAADALKGRVSLHPSVLLWLSVLFYVRPELVLPLLLAAGVHELGHFAVLSALKRPPVRITLSFLGARMETPPLGYREAVFAAAGGPEFSLLLGLTLPVFPVLGGLSLLLGAINLLPLGGLDGGTILKNFLLHTLPERAARWVGGVIQLLFSAALLLLALRLTGKYGLVPLAAAAGILLRAER